VPPLIKLRIEHRLQEQEKLLTGLIHELEEMPHIEALDRSSITVGQMVHFLGRGFLDPSEGTTLVQFEGVYYAHKDGDEPVVVINVSEATGDEQEYTLSLGETLDLGDDIWRVSEIGMSDSEAQPGSATLIRDES
jgi:hypothetical protein